MAEPRVVHVVPGPSTHGVTRHALSLLDAGGALPEEGRAGAAGAVRAVAGPDEAAQILAAVPEGAALHLHLTDSLLADPLATVATLAAAHPLTCTLHDIPTPSEGEARYARRAALYARIAAASCAVVVASEHEAGLLRTATGGQGLACPPIAVVPLPIRAPTRSLLAERPPAEPVVAVLGFLYPGKGHAEGIRAAAAAGLEGVVALGAVSPGHEELAGELEAEAKRRGLTWAVTGFLSDAELTGRARAAALPLAHHAHVSASGSIGTWIEAGRRPLVADGPWARELEARCPGAVHIIDDLGTDARRLTVSPGLTWLGPDVQIGPSHAEAWGALDEAIRAGLARGRDQETPR